MPPVDPSRFERTKELFQELSRLRPDQVPAALQEILREQPAIHDEVIALLRQDSVLRRFAPATEPSKGVTAPEPSAPGPRAEGLDGFVTQYWQDHDRGSIRALEEYQRMFPDKAEEIADEYQSLRADLVENESAQRLGDQIGPYRILAQLGRGGQGTVYLAEDERLHRRVALKVLVQEGAVSEHRKRRFKREARIAAQLDHPGICAVLDADLEGRPPYIAMRHVEGRPLSHWMRQSGTRSEGSSYLVFTEHGSAQESDDAREMGEGTTAPLEVPGPEEIAKLTWIAIGVLRALHVAHEAHIIHRDIKPGNIMIDETGNPVILDFGLARDDAGADDSLTQVGDFMGTPAYMSPEQLLAHRISVDRRTDLYSVGVTLYECLALRSPYDANYRNELLQAIQTKPPTPLAQVNPLVPPAIVEAVHRAIEKDRDQRYSSALEMAAALEAAVSGLPVGALWEAPQAGPAAPVDRPRRSEEAAARGSQRASEDGQSSGDLRVIREIGRGGMGVVYEAEQESLKRRVALKVLSDLESREPEVHRRFLNEARLAARLQHPHIVSVYSVVAEDERLSYVMEYVPGVGLDVVIRQFRAAFLDGDDSALSSLPPVIRENLGLAGDEAVEEDSQSGGSETRRSDRLSLQRKAFAFLVESLVPVALALDHAHHMGVIHGDLKPSNLIFDLDGRLRILDFGLAQLVRSPDAKAAAGGTPQYMSPEQIEGVGRGLTPLVDVYGFGVTLYECVTLQPAFAGESTPETLRQVLEGNVTPPRERYRNLHRDLEAVIMTALARRRRHRYPSVLALAWDLQRFLRHEPVEAARGRGLRRLLSKPWGRAAAVLISAAVVGAILWGGQWLDRRREDAKITGIRHQAREKQDRGLELLATLRDADEPAREVLDRMETQLAAGRRLLMSARQARPDDPELLEHYREFSQRAAQMRVLGYFLSGQVGTAWEILNSARRRGVTDGLTDRDLLQIGGMSDLAVSIPADGQVSVTLYRLRPDALAEAEDLVARGVTPAQFRGLLAGGYLIVLHDGNQREIRFPLQVGRMESVTVELPYRPSQVPEGMVYIASSDDPFVMGDALTTWPNGDIGPVLRPLRQALFLDRCEVTNSDFEEFYLSEDYERLLGEILREDHPELDDEEIARRLVGRVTPGAWWLGRLEEGTEDFPLQGITPLQARAYGRWRESQSAIDGRIGGPLRLPREDEWEKAGRSIDGRRYPYGNRLMIENHYSEELKAVSSFPYDCSIYGVHDLMGSVRELVATVDGEGYTLRGAHHAARSPLILRLANQGGAVPVYVASAPSASDEFPSLASLGRGLRSHRIRPIGFRLARNARDMVVKRSSR